MMRTTPQALARSIPWTSLLLGMLLLAGCGGHTVQTTSGKDYLERHSVLSAPLAASSSPTTAPSDKAQGASFDQALYQVASIEPTLAFPARIGLAKIGCVDGRCGTLAPLYPEEVDAWSEMAANLGASYGSLAPINPLVMDQAQSEARRAGFVETMTALEQVRLAAARQHLDAVIVYEASSRGERDVNALALGDLTIIGAYVLPSRKIESEGYAAGIIMDPITGYPYGQIEAASEDRAFSSLAGSAGTEKDLERATAIGAAVALVAETENAIRDLRLALAEQTSDTN